MLPKLALMIALGALAFAQSGASGQKHAYTPDDVQFGAAPPSVPPGAQLAVLAGDPMASTGPYVVRLKMPANYRIAPHWHPKRENVTVISGQLKLGMGDTFDESKMQALPAGSFGYLEPEMHHYAMSTEPTIIQIHGQAPFQINYVNPADDPSHKGK